MYIYKYISIYYYIYYRQQKHLDILIYIYIHTNALIGMHKYTMPLVPHKAVAEVSKIGNL